MTASLSPAIAENFLSAASFHEFFAKREITDIHDKFEKREQAPIGVPRKSCTTNLFFGFFFDGTKNNYEQAEVTKNHSNVAHSMTAIPA